MTVEAEQLFRAMEVAQDDRYFATRPIPNVYCAIKVSADKAKRNIPGCAIASQIFDDLGKFAAQKFAFEKDPKKANLLIATFSKDEMSEFIQRVGRWKIELFSVFGGAPEYQVFSDQCLIVNFKTYPQKYIIILPEIMQESAAYDCVTLGVLLYLSYPPSLLKEKYFPGQRSFFLTGIEYSILCSRNGGLPVFNKFTINESWTRPRSGEVTYLQCQIAR